MRETLEQFRERTGFVYNRMAEDRRFETNPGLLAKADGAGRLLPYIGDTVIFDLDDGAKGWLTSVQDKLYAACGRYTLFSERLDPASFHITLHDLRSGTPDCAQEILAGIDAREEAAEAFVHAFRIQYRDRIHVRAKALMNMMGNSVVLAFEPVMEDDWAALCDMYMRLQQVVELPYKLTPHVTIAYYRPDENGYGADVTRALQQVIDEVNTAFGGREIELSLSALRYCCFADMNHYCAREELVGELKGY